MRVLSDRWRGAPWLRRGGAVLGAAVHLLLFCAGPVAATEPYVWDVPRRYPIPKTPEDNPMTVEGVALGRFLFYDERLSGNQTQSCASCHRQEIAFTDARPVGIGSTGEAHPRNSMSLTNVGYASVLAWANPLLLRLEQQILLPLFGENPVELGLAGREDELLERLRADVRYHRMFAEAFPLEGGGEPITVQNMVRAIASFNRSLVSSNTPYDDYFYRFDDDALSPSALRGLDAFFTEKFECFHCHGGGFNFSASTTFVGNQFDEIQFDNNGLYNLDGHGAFPPNNTGIHEITGVPADMGRFKAPTLRNIELTAPYMHDGSIATLEGVLVDHYGRGGTLTPDGPNAGDGKQSPLKSPFVRGFSMSAQEKEDMLNALRSLTDHRFVTNPRHSDPFVPAACVGDCDLDDDANLADVLDAIDVALGSASLAHCVPADTSGEGAVTVDELVKVVLGVQGECS